MTENPPPTQTPSALELAGDLVGCLIETAQTEGNPLPQTV